MNTELLQTLSAVGLSEKEARAYLACLQVGRGTVYQIAKVANLKRPNVYVLVDELVQKGLIATRIENKKTICSPLSPRQLVERWQGKVEALWSIIPDLNTYYQKGLYQPKVMMYEGEQGINAVYNEITPGSAKTENIFVFGSISALREKFPHQLKVWERIARNKRNHIKELVNFEEGAVEYIKRINSLGNPHYEGRVTKSGVFGACDNVMYKNKIAIFSLKKELFVVVIESEELTKTYKALFEMAWENAKKI